MGKQKKRMGSWVSAYLASTVALFLDNVRTYVPAAVLGMDIFASHRTLPGSATIQLSVNGAHTSCYLLIATPHSTLGLQAGLVR